MGRLIYRPNKTVRERRERVYKHVADMFEVKNQKYPEFANEWGERALQEYVDDSLRRINGTPPVRETQGKEDWQANVFPPETRTKLRTFISGIASRPPDFAYKSWNGRGVQSVPVAEISKNLVRHSRMTKGHNVKKEIFKEAWNLAGVGTVIKYDGWFKSVSKRKIPTKYDPVTGVVDYEEREAVAVDRAVDDNVPLDEFLVWNIRIEDVQRQVRIARVQYKSEEEVEEEFGQYSNFKYLKSLAGVNQNFEGEKNGYYSNHWGTRAEKKNSEFEIIREYDKSTDEYIIYINGVEMIYSPLVWGHEEKKYPYAKSINEPFADVEFFYGKSLPSVFESFQDSSFVFWNLVLDKAIRSLNTPLLIGTANRDVMDFEDEFVTMDNRYYVPDISQVKPMPYPEVTSGDFALLQGIQGQFDRHSVGVNQSGGQTGNTAREVILADRRAQELKDSFFLFLEDLWLQKERLRLNTVQLHYMQPQINLLVGADKGKAYTDRMRIFDVPDTNLPDGSTGTLGIHIANSKDTQLNRRDIEDREKISKEQGINYKLVSITYKYLDDWELDFGIIPESLVDIPQEKKEARVLNKQQNTVTLYPEYFAQNKQKFFKEFIEVYGENVEDYDEPQPSEAEQVLSNSVDPLDEAALSDEQPVV